MIMSDQLICGIDIGSAKISTVVATQLKEEDQLRIIGFNTTRSRGVKKGLIVDIDQVTSAVEESVEKAERMAGHKITRAYVSVGGPHIASINSHGVVAISNPQEGIVSEDVERVVDAARAISLSTTRQIIDVAPREYIVDGQPGIKNPVGMSGVRLEVDTHIVTASLTNLKNISRCLADLDIQNAGFVFCGFASAEAVLTDTEKELGVCLVDIGGGKVDICLYADGALSYSGSIAIGARHVTNDIAVGMRVSLESAERIKLYLSKHVHELTKKPKKDDHLDLSSLQLPEQITEVSTKMLLDGIIGSRLEEIYRLVGEEIEKSGFATGIPSGVVITGGGALTVGMIETGRKILGLPIRVGVPSEVSGLLDEILDPQYAATVGLILSRRKNIIAEDDGIGKFNKVFRGVSIGRSAGKLKEIIKQFIP